MKITIDTKEDSHEEIKKVISLLTHLIGETPRTNATNIFDNPESTPDNNDLMNMFDSGPAKTSEDEEEPEEETQVIPY